MNSIYDFIIADGKLLRYIGNDIDVTVPENVTAIGDSAFFWFKELRSIRLPEGLIHVGTSAFSGTALEELDLPEGLTSIAPRAFCGCGKLRRVSLPQSLKTVGESAFRDCGALQDISLPEKLVFVGNSAFAGCVSLRTLTLPAGVRHLQTKAFQGVRLERLTINSGAYAITPKTVCDVFDGAVIRRIELNGEYAADQVGSVMPAGLHRIGSMGDPGGFSAWSGIAAKNCLITSQGVLLTCLNTENSITLPEDVIAVGACAFYGNRELCAVTLTGDLTEIGKYAFSDCADLEEIRINKSVRRIGENAFAGCRKLKAFVFPQGLTELGDGAFTHCEALREIKLPQGIEKIGPNTFSGCASLQKAELPDGLLSVGDFAFFQCALETVSLPQGLRALGPNAFALCAALRYISIPLSLREIGANAFLGCRALEEIVLPEGLTEIRDETFRSCGSLKRALLPKSLISIGNRAFDGCETMEDVEIPASLTRIGEEAFARCQAIKTAILPAGLKELGKGVFKECGALTRAALDCRCEEIPEDAFYKCASLRSAALNGAVSKIGYRAFYGCASLERLSLPEGLRQLGEFAFAHCVSLRSIALPNSLRELRKYVFSGCERLAQVNFREGLTRIGEKAFDGCKALSEIDLPESLESIGSCAFRDCSNLTAAPLPAGLKHVSPTAFDRAGLRAFAFPGENIEYKTENGCLLTADGKTLVAYPPHADPLKCRIPSSVTGIGKNAIGFLPAHYIRIPAAVQTVSPEAFIRTCTEDFALSEVTAHANAFRNHIYLGDPYELPVTVRSAGVINFLKAVPLRLLPLEKYTSLYADYIRAHAETYLRYAEEDGDVMAFFLSRELIPAEAVPGLLREAENDVDMTAALLDYQQKCGRSELDDFDLTDDDPEMRRMLRLEEIRKQIADGKGLADIIFVISGRRDLKWLKEQIEGAGGTVRDTVSGKTDFVVTFSEEPNAVKIRRAKALGVPVIGVNTLQEMLRGKFDPNGL